MSESRRPKNPRRVADGTGRALRDHLGKPPEGNFADGVEAHVQYRRMCPETEPGCDLGPYIPLDRDGNSDAVHLDGEPPRTIRFPAFWRKWFAAQNERTLRILDRIIEWLDEHGEDEAEKRLADLDEVVLRHRAHRQFVSRLKWASKYAVPAAGMTWGALTFAQERIGRVIEQLPVLRAVWKAIMGSTG